MVPVPCLSTSQLVLSQHRVPRRSRAGSNMLKTRRRPVDQESGTIAFQSVKVFSCRPTTDNRLLNRWLGCHTTSDSNLQLNISHQLFSRTSHFGNCSNNYKLQTYSHCS